MKRFLHKNSDVTLPFTILFTGMAVVVFVMMTAEGMSLLNAVWFSIVTASTVGYGDISPSTKIGKLIVGPYILTSVVALASFVSVSTGRYNELRSKKKRGMVKMKNKTDVLIIGYPSESKVRTLISELRKSSRFENQNIVCLTIQIEHKPDWMSDENVSFVHGLASKKDVLMRAGVEDASHIVLLANNPEDEVSDEFTSSAILMCEKLNSDAYTIAEKVRFDPDLFEMCECDQIVDVCRPNEIAHELTNHGAIELLDCLFSYDNGATATQRNLVINQDFAWSELVAHLCSTYNAIPIGYKETTSSSFKFAPKGDFMLLQGSTVKYIAKDKIINHEFES